jgi:hypothetical protein
MTGRLAKNFRQRISFRPPEGEEEVIVETIPKKKKLADTGGSALILPAGALLLSAGLLLGRSVIRRVL